MSYITNIYGQMVCGEYAEPPEPEVTPEPVSAPEPVATPTPITEPVVAPEPVTAPVSAPEPTAATKPAAAPEPVTKPEPAPKPTPVVTAEPAAPPVAYHCYWQQTRRGKSTWVLIKELNSKEDCFKMDSCNGGGGASRGICFKWATAADAPPQPW